MFPLRILLAIIISPFMKVEAQTGLVAILLGSKYRCAGSMYNNFYIISSGECTSLIQTSSDVRYYLSVIVGTTNYKSNGTRHLVKDIIYPDDGKTNIVLLKLETPIVNPNAKSILLDSNPFPENVNVTTLNWQDDGRSIDGPFATYNSQCIPSGGTNLQMCVKYVTDGTCSHGAPVLLNNKQVGVKTYSQNCVQDGNDVYSKIAGYYDWIVQKAV